MKVVTGKPEAKGYETHKTLVLQAIADAPGAAISFDAIRAACGKDDKALPDGHIHQIAIDAGYKPE